VLQVHRYATGQKLPRVRFFQGLAATDVEAMFLEVLDALVRTEPRPHPDVGKSFPGVATYIPAPTDSLGRLIEDEKDGYDLNLITYREISQTKSRTVSNYWLLALLPENSIIMNSRDAQRLGLKDGSLVRVISATNLEGSWDLKNGKKIPMIGRVKVIQGIKPGVVAFSLGHGHWAYGASDVVVDGKRIAGDGRRGKGIHANAALRIDPHIKNTCLSDLTGGSAVFYDTKVKLLSV